MRITEVNDPELRRRNIGADYAAEEYLSEEEEEYFTEEEYNDDEGLDVAPRAKGLRQRVSNVVAALSPSRLGKTLKGTSISLIHRSKAMARTAGNLAWIVTTSMILVGLPVLYAYDREKNTSAQNGQMLPLDK